MKKNVSTELIQGLWSETRNNYNYRIKIWQKGAQWICLDTETILSKFLNNCKYNTNCHCEQEPVLSGVGIYSPQFNLHILTLSLY